MNKKTFFLIAFSGILVILTVINLVYLKLSISIIESGKQTKIDNPITTSSNSEEIIAMRSKKDHDKVHPDTGKQYENSTNKIPPITTSDNTLETISLSKKHEKHEKHIVNKTIINETILINDSSKDTNLISGNDESIKNSDVQTDSLIKDNTETIKNAEKLDTVLNAVNEEKLNNDISLITNANADASIVELRKKSKEDHKSENHTVIVHNTTEVYKTTVITEIPSESVEAKQESLKEIELKKKNKIHSNSNEKNVNQTAPHALNNETTITPVPQLLIEEKTEITANQLEQKVENAIEPAPAVSLVENKDKIVAEIAADLQKSDIIPEVTTDITSDQKSDTSEAK